MKVKPRLAVVSPFLSKRFGTERIIVEWIMRLADTFEIHAYSQRVEDVNLEKITWHKIPKLPGPHLFNYLWWFFANHIRRAWDRRFRGISMDIIFSPGVNCLDANVVSVHIVFAEYASSVVADLRFRTHSLARWPQVLHRKLYYHLITSLERRIYARSENVLVLIARKTDREIARHYGYRGPSPVIYLGLDHGVFNPQRRASLRDNARTALGYSNERFVLLLIGNHWANKGLPVVLEALAILNCQPIDLLVVGREDADEYTTSIDSKRLSGRVQFHPPRSDVEFYYAAADAYAGPSLEDTFALPPAEAMACGLPVIVSAANGTCEIITHESDGLILQDPLDAVGLATMVRRIYEDRGFRERLGENAHKTSLQYTWERNARELNTIFEQVLKRKSDQKIEAARERP